MSLVLFNGTEQSTIPIIQQRYYRSVFLFFFLSFFLFFFFSFLIFFFSIIFDVSLQLKYNSLEALCRDRMILENILATPILISQSFRSAVSCVTKITRDWISKVPPMLFPPTRLADAFNEVL